MPYVRRAAEPREGLAMSRKTFCDLCGAEINGHAAKAVAVSAEYEMRFGCITSDDAMDVCDGCYMRLREAIEECKERGKHE